MVPELLFFYLVFLLTFNARRHLSLLQALHCRRVSRSRSIIHLYQLAPPVFVCHRRFVRLLLILVCLRLAPSVSLCQSPFVVDLYSFVSLRPFFSGLYSSSPDPVCPRFQSRFAFEVFVSAIRSSHQSHPSVFLAQNISISIFRSVSLISDFLIHFDSLQISSYSVAPWVPLNLTSMEKDRIIRPISTILDVLLAQSLMTPIISLRQIK